MYHEITETLNSKTINQNLIFQNKNAQIALDCQQKLFHGKSHFAAAAEHPLVNCSNTNGALSNFENLAKENSLRSELFI
jgi:hypothetical protein